MNGVAFGVKPSAGNGFQGLSPISDSSAPSLTPSHSPNQHTYMGSAVAGVPGAGPHGAGHSASFDMQWAPDGQAPGFAPRACEKCRLSKRRCDKKLPHCDRCVRLNAKCHYVQDALAPNANPNGPHFVVYQSQPLSSDVMLRSADPLENITVPQILGLLNGPDTPPDTEPDWKAPIHAYFQYIHPWYAVVHPTLFDQRMSEIQSHPDYPSPARSQSASSYGTGQSDAQASFKRSPSQPETDLEARGKDLALLIVAMHLVTRCRRTHAGLVQMFDETYRVLKRLVSLVALNGADGPPPSIEIVQCSALLALYEYGHGESNTAYRTLAQAAANASVVGVAPGYGDKTASRHILADEPLELSTLDKEERGGIWWSLFILDQFLHRDETATHLPFILETPAYNALLPEMPILTSAPGWKVQTSGHTQFPANSIRRQPVSVVLGNEDLGTFQLSAKCSSLLHRALRLDKERSSLPHMSTSTFSDLDQELRRATQTLIERSMHWELMLDCFSMCISALFTLYLPYLPRIETSSVAQIDADPELRIALAALRFACKMSTDISCKINAEYMLGGDNSSNVDVLSAPVGATCYLVIIVFSSFRRIFPDENLECQRAIAEKFESLRLFSSRWGIAEKMMRLLEQKRGINREEYLTPVPTGP
ncbi:hypothetical protein Micbo1qcDRAFT_68198 [Microdochium bolleyi]|uniref:Zn(2)-C6 fungal-type domain-containing protein n=1 Tax=Microdochium bolleyi TaxID=196109 RepID=A0A136J168_9PEZI|nr:hypothetical protein Micbo1qcDRAFT_68198 [Microdochium bolleyi]